MQDPTNDPTNPTDPMRRPLSAAFLAAARRVGTFTVLLEGGALSPRYADGDLLLADARAIAAPGDVVIAAVAVLDGADETAGSCGHDRGGRLGGRGTRYAAMFLNADGDLTDGEGGYVAAGTFTVAGVVTDRLPALDLEGAGDTDAGR